MRLVVFAIYIGIAWLVRDLMSWPWWIVVCVVSGLLRWITRYAHSPDRMIRPRKPVPLQIVNTAFVAISEISLIAAVLPLIVSQFRMNFLLDFVSWYAFVFFVTLIPTSVRFCIRARKEGVSYTWRNVGERNWFSDFSSRQLSSL